MNRSSKTIGDTETARDRATTVDIMSARVTSMRTFGEAEITGAAVAGTSSRDYWSSNN